MAIKVTVKQSSLEKLIFPVNWKLALLDGVDVIDLTITHTPPTGGDVKTFGKTIDTPVSYVKSPSSLDVGKHYVSLVAITTNVDLQPEVYLVINVER